MLFMVSSLKPMIIWSRLLNSCATPPANWPTASSFCAWRSFASMPRFSVMSSETVTTPVISPPWSTRGTLVV